MNQTLGLSAALLLAEQLQYVGVTLLSHRPRRITTTPSSTRTPPAESGSPCTSLSRVPGDVPR